MLALKATRDAVIARLDAVWAAKTDEVAALIPTVSAADVSAVREIDWARSDQSREQVYYGQYALDDLLDSTSLSWPVATISISSATSPDATNGKVLRNARWSGDAPLVIEIHFTSTKGTAVPDIEDVADFIGEILARCLLDVAWGTSVDTWTNYVSMTRSGVIEAGENWLFTLTWEQIFQVEG